MIMYSKLTYFVDQSHHKMGSPYDTEWAYESFPKGHAVFGHFPPSNTDEGVKSIFEARIPTLRQRFHAAIEYTICV